MLHLKTKVVMLPYPKEKAPGDVVLILDNRKRIVNRIKDEIWYDETPFHIYLVADREDYRIGDRVMNMSTKQMWTVTENDLITIATMMQSMELNIQKIEATTDPELDLPRIPASFIQKFMGKQMDVTYVNVQAEQLVGNIKNPGSDFPEFYPTVVTRPDGTVILSKVIPHFTYEDMLKAYRYSRQFKDKTAEEFLFEHYEYKSDTL